MHGIGRSDESTRFKLRAAFRRDDSDIEESTTNIELYKTWIRTRIEEGNGLKFCSMRTDGIIKIVTGYPIEFKYSVHIRDALCRSKPSSARLVFLFY